MQLTARKTLQRNSLSHLFLQGIGNLAPYSFFNIMSCDLVSSALFAHAVQDDGIYIYSCRPALAKAGRFLQSIVDCPVHVIVKCRFVASQPYVCIGAMTTRERPGKGIKDSHQNINETGYVPVYCGSSLQ